MTVMIRCLPCECFQPHRKEVQSRAKANDPCFGTVCGPDRAQNAAKIAVSHLLQVYRASSILSPTVAQCRKPSEIRTDLPGDRYGCPDAIMQERSKAADDVFFARLAVSGDNGSPLMGWWDGLCNRSTDFMASMAG